MTFLLGDTGKTQIGTLKTFTITPPTPRETLLGTPLVLPTSEPGTSQVIYTVQSSDLPTISPVVPMKYNAVLVCSGKAGATTASLSYRILKNGSSITQVSGISVTTAQFWTHTHWRTFDVQVGDVLEARYWSNQTDSNLDFYGLFIIPSQPVVSKDGTLLKDLILSNIASDPSFVTTFTGVSTQSYFLFPFSGSIAGTQNDWVIAFGNTYTVGALAPNPLAGLYKTSVSDRNGAATNQAVHATQRQVQKQIYPKTISFREVLR